MKKLLTWIFVLTFVLGLLVYQAVMLSMPKEEPRHISDMLVERSWSLYLILPISQEEADVFCSRDVLEQIDLDILQEAETKLWDRINSYPDRQEPSFTIYKYNEEIRLSVELIVIYDPPHISFWPTSTDPTAPTPSQRGCGIDHDHLNFYELISKTGDS